jgi:hypothetical protein
VVRDLADALVVLRRLALALGQDRVRRAQPELLQVRVAGGVQPSGVVLPLVGRLLAQVDAVAVESCQGDAAGRGRGAE